MPGKDLAVSLVVGAALNKSFGKTFRSADERLAKLHGGIKSAQEQARQIQSFRRLQGGLIKAQAAAREAQDRVVSLGRAMKQTQAPTKKMRAELARAHKEAHRANKRFEAQRRALNDQRLAMKKAGLSTANLASQEKRLGQAVEETRRRYDRMAASMARAQARKDRRAELRTRGMGLLGAAYSAARIFEESFGIEEQTIRLKTVINAEDGAAEAATKRSVRHAREVARRTLASESELLEIQYELNSAGLSEAASRAGSEVASKVATVTKGDVGQVAKIMGGVFNNMGASIEGAGVEEKLGRIGDVLTKTQFKFQLSDFGQLGEGLSYAAAGATANRLSLEQTAAAIGMMNSAQVEGSRAGTALSAVLRQMGKASDELGFKIIRDAEDNLDLGATLEGLRDSLSVYDDIDERNQMLQKVFGEEGMVGVMPLLDRLDQYRQGLESVAKAEGLVAESYQQFLDSSGGQWTMFVQNVTAIGTALGDTLLPALNMVLTPLAEIAGWLGAQIEKWPALGKAIGTVATGAAVAFTAEYMTGGGVSRFFGRRRLPGADHASRGLTSVGSAATRAAAALRSIGGGAPLTPSSTKGRNLTSSTKGRNLKGLWGRTSNWVKGAVGGPGAGRRAMNFLKGKGGVGLGTALAALSVGSTMLDREKSAGEKATAITADVGNIGGALAGAAAGAALGSIVPVVGTAVGGILGGILGGWAGGAAGGALAEKADDLFGSGSGIAEEVAGLTPALAAAGGDTTIDNSIETMEINIQQQPGEDARALADRVMREIEDRRQLASRKALLDES